VMTDFVGKSWMKSLEAKKLNWLVSINTYLPLNNS